MTLITFQDGKVLFRDGKVGTEAGCCCGQCASLCPCEGLDFPVAPAGIYWPPAFDGVGCAGATTGLEAMVDCENGFDADFVLGFDFGFPNDRQNPTVLGRTDFTIYCDGNTPVPCDQTANPGVQYYSDCILIVAGDLVCTEIVNDHPTAPGCGRNCEIRDPVIAVFNPPPCFDASLLELLVCPPPA